MLPISLFLSPAEENAVRSAARKAGVPLNDFIRSAIMCKKEVVMEQLLANTSEHLRSLGLPEPVIAEVNGANFSGLFSIKPPSDMVEQVMAAVFEDQISGSGITDR